MMAAGLFDIDQIATQAGVPPDKLRRLESSVREQYRGDAMMSELRMLRTLRAIRDGALTIDEAIFEAETPDAAEALDLLERRGDVTRSQRDQIRDFLISQLSVAERFVVVCYYYERLSYREIATALGSSEGEIARIHESVIERLRRQFGQPLTTRVFRLAS